MKLWALNVCVACILAGALELFLPRQGSYKSIKTVLALYILVSVVSPAAGADWRGLAALSIQSSARPADYSAYAEAYAWEQLEDQLEQALARQGITATVRCTGGEAPCVTVYSDQPERALELALDALGDTQGLTVTAKSTDEG